MLTSLFGALYPRRAPAVPGPEQDFAPTAMLESPARALDTGGGGPEPLQTQDVLVRGTTGDALCRRLLTPTVPAAGTRATRRITLFDPGRLWARDVVKLLADTSGEPLERIYLRRQDTLSTLAMVERTALPRRIGEPLQVAHVEVRSSSLRAASVPLALLGRSHLAVVVLAPMAPSVLDELLALLHEAVRRPDWGCPNLLFVLGPHQPASAARLAEVQWPAHLNVAVLAEPLASPSAAWNAVLRNWSRLKLQPQRVSPAGPPSLGGRGAPAPGGGPVPGGTAAAARTAVAALLGTPAVRPSGTRHRLDQVTMLRALETLAGVRGVRGAAVADSTTGLVLGRRYAARADTPDLDEAAITLSEVLKAHRRATLGSADGQGIEEVLVTHPLAHKVLRTLASHPQLFLFVVLDRAEGTLALARHAVAQAGKRLD